MKEDYPEENEGIANYYKELILKRITHIRNETILKRIYIFVKSISD